jgi:hypothetical protein
MTRSIRLLFLLLALGAALPAEDSWTGVERVVAVGDVHGDHDPFVAVLRSAGVIDEKDRWSGGKTHLVQTGDILDRGPDSRKSMDLLMRLEEEAKAAGGAVHALIGNHEAMNITGDLRYVAPGEYDAFRDADSAKARDALFLEHEKKSGRKFDDAYRKAWNFEVPLGFAEHRSAFAPTGKYGKWILGHNAVVRIDDSIFLHAGLSPRFADWGIRRINEQIREELADPAKHAGGIVANEEGPLWYRGLARGVEREAEGHLDALLRKHEVKRIVIGHTFTEGAIIPRFGGRVLQIDVGLCRLYDPRLRMACLVIEKGKVAALHRGKKIDLPSDEGADLLRYLYQAAALDPSPSPLAERIRDLELRLKK